MTQAQWDKIFKELQDYKTLTTDQERLKEIQELESYLMDNLPSDCKGDYCG